MASNTKTPLLVKTLEKIAIRNVSTINTLKPQHSDSLDFHEVHITTIHKMLQEAFELGLNVALSTK